jgi:hypothetical protein
LTVTVVCPTTTFAPPMAYPSGPSGTAEATGMTDTTYLLSAGAATTALFEVDVPFDTTGA